MFAPEPLTRPPQERKPRRRRRFPRFLLLLAVTALVLFAALYLVTASALDTQRIRTALQDSVLRTTGRTLTINGPIHLAIGLAPRLEVEDIALANIEGGSRPQMLTAHTLTASLALLPLLTGDAVISSVILQQPDLLLERTADGTPNWQFAAPRRALYQGHGENGGGGGHTEIREIALREGQLTWQQREGAPRTLRIVDASISAANPDSPVSLSIAGALPAGQPGSGDGLPFTLTGAFGSLQRLHGQNVSALAGTWPVLLKLTLQGADVKLEGGINHPEQMRSYQLRLTGHADNLAVFNALLPQPSLPPLAGVNATALLSDSGDGALRTSQLSLRAEKSDLSTYVPGLIVDQAQMTGPGPGQLAQLAIEGTYQDQKLRLAAAMTQPDVISTTTPLQLTFSMQAAGGNLSAHGTVPPSLQTAGLDMQIEAHAPHLADLSPLLGRRLPNADDVSFNAEFEDAGVKLHGITVHNFVLNSSLGDANGDLTLGWTPRGSLTGTLASHSLNLDALLSGVSASGLPAIWPPAAADAAAAIAMPGQPPATPPFAGMALPGAVIGLPLPWLRNNDANVALTIGSLTAGGAAYRDVSANLALQDGKLVLNPLRGEGPDGALVAGLSIDATTDAPPVALSLRSPSIAASAVASLLGYPQEGTAGTMQVDATLSGAGQTLASFESGMNGHVGLAMVNGTVNNAVLQGLLGDVLQAQGAPSLGDGSTAVRCLALRMDFRRGTGAVRSLALDTSRLALSGTGTVNLPDHSANLRLRPQLRLGPTSVSSAVTLEGQFGSLHAGLDPAFSNGRVGLQIGGAPQSNCYAALAVARNGLGGAPVLPPPPATPLAADPAIPLTVKKPKDLLQGLFH